MSTYCAALGGLLLLMLCGRLVFGQDPDVVQACTAFKQQVYEKKVGISFLFNNAPVMYETVDSCHGTRPLIVGGQPAEAKEFPHIARLGHHVYNRTDWFCGGTLISDRFVLTAAHCFYSTRGELNIVRLGELDFGSTTDDAEPEDFRVANYVEHPNYNNRELYDDIGLVQLDRPVKFNVYKSPACMPFDDGRKQSNFIAIGWGSTTSAGEESMKLLKVNLNQYANICSKVYEPSSQLTKGYNASTQLCIGSSQSKDTCNGDSGGPVLSYHEQFPCMYHVLGITSNGIGCGTPNLPSLYTRVHFYLDWIKQEISGATF